MKTIMSFKIKAYDKIEAGRYVNLVLLEIIARDLNEALGTCEKYCKRETYILEEGKEFIVKPKSTQASSFTILCYNGQQDDGKFINNAFVEVYADTEIDAIKKVKKMVIRNDYKLAKVFDNYIEN